MKARIYLHLRCLIARPNHILFHLAGIAREVRAIVTSTILYLAPIITRAIN